MGERTRTGQLTGNLELLFQLKGVGVVQTDLETGRFVRANRAFCEMVGYREADLQALTYEEVTHPDDRARDAESFAALQRGELQGSDAVTRVLRRDGATVWLELHVSILHEAGHTYNVAVAHDVTERKRAEAARRDSEARAQLALEVGRLGTWGWDPDRDEVFADARCREICGLDQGVALTLADVAARVHPEDWKRVKAALGAALQPGGTHRYAEEFRFVHPDGAVRWVVSRGHVRSEGEEVGLLGTVLDITARKEVEAQLSYQLELTQTITDNTQSCLLMMDAHGRGTFANEAAERVTGFKREELIGHVLHDRIHHTHPDGRPFPIDECPLDRALPVRESVVGYEDVFVHKDGHFYPVRCNARPIFGEGKPVGTVIEVQDITEEKRVEEGRRAAEAERERLLGTLQELNATLEQRVEERTRELRQSERRFSQAFSAGPIAACISTLDGETLLEVNDAFSRLTGYSQDEAVGRTHEQLGMWSSEKDQIRLERARDAGGNVRNLELTLRTRTGERKDILLSAGVIDLGGIKARLKMFYDITQRKEAEAERELLRQAMDNAEEAVLITTADLDLPGPRIEYVNAAFTKMTGYQSEELLGRTPRMFQGPKTDRAVLRRMRRRLKVGRTFQGESVNYRKDGSTYVLAWNIAPIYDAGGQVSHWVSTQHDVTERRALEREILDISAREQRRVAGDLHDSVQQQLVGTAMQAKRLVSLAQAYAPDLAVELDALYASVQDSVKSVRTMLEGITPLQENENGLMVALESMCQRVTGLFGTPCTFNFEEPLLIQDFERATQLYYIAQEATINAASHAEASGVEVRLSGNGAERMLTVTDDGMGMDEKVLRRRNKKGLGLMEYRAKLIGAQLEVSSAPSRGTTVSCSFDV